MQDRNFIHKYHIETVNQVFEIELPKSFIPLTFRSQNSYPIQGDQLYLWAVVSKEEELRKFKMIAIGTGIEIPGDKEWIYIGTTQNGLWIWHLFMEADDGR